MEQLEFIAIFHTRATILKIGCLHYLNKFQYIFIKYRESRQSQ